MYPCVLYISCVFLYAWKCAVQWIGNYLLPQDHPLQENGINEFQENCKEIVAFHILFFTFRFIETGLFYRRQNEREVVADRISSSMSKNIYIFQWSMHHDKNENCERSEELYIDKSWRKEMYIKIESHCQCSEILTYFDHRPAGK